MESCSEAGRINISESTYIYISNYFNCTLRGKIMAKGIGEIEMYFVDGPLTKIDEAILA
jgi:adenylate cyclase